MLYSIPHIPASENYTKAKVQDANESYYVVYNEEEYHKYNPDNAVLATGYKIVKSTNFAPLGFTARSARGVDMNGCALFEYRYFSGEHHNFRNSISDITMYFTNPAEGISSIIISQGLWAFYTRKNYQGTRVVIDGKDTFGPGFKSEYIGAADDRIMSAKLLQDA